MFCVTLFWTVEFSKEDMAKSLLHMISNDIGQLACLYAKLHNLSRVYFGGFFIRGHPVTMHTITYSINFFTKARPTALQTETPNIPLLIQLCFVFSPSFSLISLVPNCWSAELDNCKPDFNVIDFVWSHQGEVQALFLRHEGYLGAIGAFLKGAEEDSKEKHAVAHYCLRFWCRPH